MTVNDISKYPDFLIIGAPRCGTTFLAKSLGLHPEVFIPLKKELHFFDLEFHKGPDYYKSYFESFDSRLIKGEATPDYLYLPQIPKLIKEVCPDVKLIVSLRNPIDRAYSHYWNLVSKNKISPDKNFIDVIEQEKRILEQGYYAEQLEKYLGYFPKEKLLIIIYEEFFQNIDTEIKKIYNFLEFKDKSFMPNILHQKINSAANKIGRSKLVNIISRIGIKYDLKFVLEIINRTKSDALPVLNENDRFKLKEVYSNSVHKLEEILNRKIILWSDFNN